MQNNFNLRQNMQISQNTPYGGLNDSFDMEFEKVSKNYNVHRKQEIKDFMREHWGLLEYLDNINPIIENYFPDYEKCLTFCSDPEFSTLDDVVVHIICSEDSFDVNWKKLDKLNEELFYIDNFPNKLKKLLFIDLWVIV